MPEKRNSKAPARRRPPGRGGGRIRSALLVALALVVIVPPVQVLIFRFVPPPITILMIERLFEGKGMDYRWRPLERISPALPDAVVASEDERFCLHHGFDFEAMQRALKANAERPDKLRGGSTISQQTAKNVFLWPGRSYVRKAIEAGYTVLIETVWGKRRIMEVYLNVVEFGPGVYGAEAASERFFHEPASALDSRQSARLAAVLPKPLAWRAASPGPFVARRSRRIGGAMGFIRNDGLADCAR